MIIGISGKLGCGKSTLAAYLASQLNEGPHLPFWGRHSFGAFLKEEVAEVFKFPLSLCYSQESKEKWVEIPPGLSLPGIEVLGSTAQVRTLLQRYGTDYIRKHKPDHWVECMQKYISNLKEGAAIFSGLIIDDVRFVNEADICDITIRVQPYPGYVLGPHADHESETALDEYAAWDVVAYPKYGSLEECAEKIIAELNDLGKLE